MQLITVASISVERYEALSRPFEKRSRRIRILVSIAASWIVGLFCMILTWTTFPESPTHLLCIDPNLDEAHRLLSYELGLYIFMPLSFLSVLIIVVCYINILFLIQKHVKNTSRTLGGATTTKRSQVAPIDSDEQTTQENAASKSALGGQQRWLRASRSGKTETKAAGSRHENSSPIRTISQTVPFEKHSNMNPSRGSHKDAGFERPSSAQLREDFGQHRLTRSNSDSATPRERRSHDPKRAIVTTSNKDVQQSLTEETQSPRQANADEKRWSKNSTKSHTPLRKSNQWTSEIRDEANADLKRDGSDAAAAELGADGTGDATDDVPARFVGDAAEDSHQTPANSLALTALGIRGDARFATRETVEFKRPDVKVTQDKVPVSFHPVSHVQAGTSDTNHRFAALGPADLDRVSSNKVKTGSSDITIHDAHRASRTPKIPRHDTAADLSVTNNFNRIKGKRKMEAKSALRTAIVLATFLLAWLPFPLVLVTLWVENFHTSTATQVEALLFAYMVSLTFSLLAASVNPLVYGAINKPFYKELRRLVKRCRMRVRCCR